MVNIYTNGSSGFAGLFPDIVLPMMMIIMMMVMMTKSWSDGGRYDFGTF